MRDLVSQNIVNLRLIFGYSVHPDLIFGTCNFQLLILCQTQNVATVPKLSSFSIRVFPSSGSN